MKIDLVFLVILGFMVLKTVCSNKTNTKEHMAISNNMTISDDMTAAIKQFYNADITSIQNLVNIADALQKDGFTCPGKITVIDDIIASGKLIIDGSINTRFIANELDTEDWLRIGCNSSTKMGTHLEHGVAKIAMYGGICINAETTDTKGSKYSGLSVGSWSANNGRGNITATGVITGTDCQTAEAIGLKKLDEIITELENKYSKITLDSNSNTHITGNLLIDNGSCCLTNQWYLYGFETFDRGMGVRDDTTGRGVNGVWPFFTVPTNTPGESLTCNFLGQ